MSGSAFDGDELERLQSELEKNQNRGNGNEQSGERIREVLRDDALFDDVKAEVEGLHEAGRVDIRAREIADELGADRSPVGRILRMLAEDDILEQVSGDDTRTYHVLEADSA